jgi:hypothetical protein
MYRKVKRESLMFEAHICAAKAFRPTGDPEEENFIRYASAVMNGRAHGPSDIYSFMKRPLDGPTASEPRDVDHAPWSLPSLRFLRATSLWNSLRAGITSSSAIAQGTHAAYNESAENFTGKERADVGGSIPDSTTDSGKGNRCLGADTDRNDGIVVKSPLKPMPRKNIKGRQVRRAASLKKR